MMLNQNLIIPREQIRHLEYLENSKFELVDNLNSNLQKNIPLNLEEKVLVYSTGKNIYVLDNKTTHRISSRSDDVYSLCSHDGILYDGGNYNSIFETLSNKKIASRESNISSLCSHNGALYDGGLNYGVFETFLNKKINSRGSPSLCSHNNILYGSVNYLGKYSIFNIFTDGNLVSKNGPIGSLCSHEGVMYYSCSFDRTIYEVLTDKKITSRKGIIRNLHSFDGVLYDSGYYDCIADTFKNEKVVIDNYVDSLNIDLDLIRACGIRASFDVMLNKNKHIIFYSQNLALCSHPRKDFIKAGILDERE